MASDRTGRSKFQQVGMKSVILPVVLRARSRPQPPADTLRPLWGHPEIDPGQPFAVQVEVRQGEARAQPLVVLLQAAIAHLGMTKDALKDTEGPLHLGPHPCFGAVPA